MAHELIPTVEALEEEVRDLGRRLSAAQALLEAARVYQQLSPVAKPTTKSVLSNVEAATIVPRPRFRLGLSSASGGAMSQTENTAAKLMDSLKRPVSTGEIVKEQESQGHELPENASNVISARMSNSKKFVGGGRRGTGWWFADQPWPGDESELFKENGSAAEAAEP
jgi:hypothetical protein